MTSVTSSNNAGFTSIPTPFPVPTDLSNNGTNSGLGSATYYAAIGSAILVMLAVSFTSRIMYIRRARAMLARDRMELSRRGEEGGLPTYVETTAPQTLSYLNSPLSPYQSAYRVSSPVPTSHPAYAPPNLSRPNRTYHPQDTAAPPAYLGLPLPPKYFPEGSTEGEEEEARIRREGEEEVVGGDREPEMGGSGQEVDAEVAEASWSDLAGSPISQTHSLGVSPGANASGSGSRNGHSNEELVGNDGTMEEINLGTTAESRLESLTGVPERSSRD